MDNVSQILKSKDLPDREFEKISAMVYDICRINLHDGKKELVQARLNKRLRLLGLSTYKEYLKLIENDASGAELSSMVDMLTTNLTFFFREPDHFDFLREHELKKVQGSGGRRLRIWCAGCATGEEAYSLAIVLNEALSERDASDAMILATDISSIALGKAKAGVYGEQRLRNTPADIKLKYFEKSIAADGAAVYEALPEIKNRITFRRLNLMDKWPMGGPFDVIFCRNVMIYFDKKTQSELVSRFQDILRPGGTFIVGHSESLTGIQHNFKFARPSIYLKD